METYKTITQKNKKFLKKLKKEADVLQSKLDALVNVAVAITQEETEGGYTFDYILNNSPDVDELLENLRIKVK